MNLIKIGKFIQEKRKEKGLTQSELAEKLYLSDRAISKWESGICLPDADNMIELCNILSITINDLFSGEIVNKNNIENNLEKNLIEMTKIKEEKERQLIKLEYILGYITSISFLSLIFIASYINMSMIIRIALLLLGFIILIIGSLSLIKIEIKVGLYECSKCHYKFIPNYKNILLSFQFWQKRYLKCPKCNKRSWNRKVVK